jgi:dTDP-4-dehydrorhamnose reductase
MVKAFITGESGTIPMIIQKMSNLYDCNIVNSQLNTNFYTKLKKHQSFKIRVPEFDFNDKVLLNNIFEEIKNTENDPDIIIHSGAFVGTDFCSNNEELAIKANIEGTLNIVNICNKYNKPLIYFSTTAVMDPDSYNENNPINFHTKINPKTLYGISKYSGELIVKNLCKTDNIVIRPVFGFGDYPDDLHSALTKLIYVMYKNISKKEENNLTILLNPIIKKSYTRVENIASCVLKLTSNFNFYHNMFNEINIGIDHNNSKNWLEITKIIKDEFLNISICDNLEFENALNKIIFKSKEDYLHYHNIVNDDLEKYDLSFENDCNFISLKEGIRKTLLSVIKNIDKEPYWL